MKYQFMKPNTKELVNLPYPEGKVTFSNDAQVNYEFEDSEYYGDKKVAIISINGLYFNSTFIDELIEFLQTVKKELDGE